MNKISYQEFEDQVVKGARERLQNEPWFKEICLDMISGLHRNNVEVDIAISRVIDDTMYWNSPHYRCSDDTIPAELR